MSSHEQPPPKRPAFSATTIVDLDDDLLREILVRLPSLPSLLRAALACRAFLDAARSSSPAFRRRFRALHPPTILGFFLDAPSPAVPAFIPLRRRSDRDLAAVVRGADLFLTRLPDPKEHVFVHEYEKYYDLLRSPTGWQILDCRDGFVVFLDLLAGQITAYNPLTRALEIIPQLPFRISGFKSRFCVWSSDQNPGSFMVFSVYLCHEARATVFSSDTRVWQELPWPNPEDMPDCIGTARNSGFIYWRRRSKPYLTVLNAATLQFSRMDLPPALRNVRHKLMAGETKDGNHCVVEATGATLSVWVWRAEEDGAERWMPANNLRSNRLENVQVAAIVDGIVYLHRKEMGYTSRFMSFSLETGELNKLMLIERRSDLGEVLYPYTMGWPSCLLQNKVSV